MRTTTRVVSTRRRRIGAGFAAGLLLLGCASDDDTGGTTTTGGSEGTETTAELTGPAPGVTADTIKIGVNYPDTVALSAAGLNFDLGDYQAAYQALADAINAEGGIHGRQLELVFAGIGATTESSDAACVKLTEDEDVFLTTGFFLGESVLCSLDTHATAVIGGTGGMTPERLGRAKAPWVSVVPDTDRPGQVITALADRGELDGKVAVFAHALDQEQLDDAVLPALQEVGVDPVETGVIDAPADDTAAMQSDVKLVAELFKAADADTLVILGARGTAWPQYMNDDPAYRPKLLFLDLAGAQAYSANQATTDTSILEGSLAGGGFGPEQARYEVPSMQDCVDTLVAAGVEVPAPEDIADAGPTNRPYQAAFASCPDMALIRAALEAAGENLNYGTLEAAIDRLEVEIPGEPTPRTYGPPPAADGDPIPYLFVWNEGTKSYDILEDE